MLNKLLTLAAVFVAVLFCVHDPSYAFGRATTFVPYSGTVTVDEWMFYENRNTTPTFPGTAYFDIAVRVQGKTPDGQIVVDVVVPIESWTAYEMFPGGIVPAFDGFNNFGGTSGLKVLQRTTIAVNGVAAIVGPFPKSLVWSVHSSQGTAMGGGAHSSTFEPPTIPMTNVMLGAGP